MTARRGPAEAVNGYVQAIQLQVSCITDSVASVAGGYFPSPRPHRLTINGGAPVALASPSRFMFTLRQRYSIVESEPRRGWTVETVGYAYAVLDSERTEVMLYHWHPVGNSPVATPHLHLERGARVGLRELREAHLPTGHVSLSAFLRLLILDLEAQPRRSDWNAILS